MESRILNTLFLPVLCLLPVMLFNTLTVPAELRSGIVVCQAPPKYNVYNVEEEMKEMIKRGDLLEPTGACAYDTYKVYVKAQGSDDAMKRKLKRSLVAALADASDKALTEYFEEGGAFINKYMFTHTKGESKRNVPLDKYCFVAADLLGEDHFLYGSLKSKGYFIEALKFRYIENKSAEVVKEKLKASIAMDSDASYTYNELGQIYFDEKNYSLACENYNRAIKLNSYWKLPQEKLKVANEALALMDSKSK